MRIGDYIIEIQWRRVALLAFVLLGVALSVDRCHHTPDGDDTITIKIHGCGWAK